MLRSLERKHTKIVATIGPASTDPEVIRKMIRAGMDVARINFSHGTHPEHANRIATIRQIAKEENAVVAFLGDIQGPKIRVGKVANEPRTLKKGDQITFTLDEVPGEGMLIQLPHPEFMKDIKKDTNLLLDDGNIEMKVIDTTPRSIVCEVIVPGNLKSNKGVSAPNASLTLSAITEDDREDIRFALEQKLDYIAMSFVRSADDIRQMRWMMNFFGAEASIIAKIELRDALDNIAEIIQETDGIMVARGDLGVETPAERVPYEQKRIIKLCNQAAKPVITATQMLESMKDNPRPTRAEASDVYNAIMDGTDAVMLSAESASGAYPVEAITVMSNIAMTAEQAIFQSRNLSNQNPFSANNVYEGSEGISNAIGAATVAISEAIKPTAIVTTTISGYTTLRVAKERPRTPILCATPSETTFRRMALVWGVIPLLVREYTTIDEMISIIVRAAHDEKMVNRGDTLVVIAGVPFGVKGQTNLIKVHLVGENGEI
jgi:pyruvate kinase